jgi:NAD(P)-dependent dehydrogenase (short-subunit alcohol dehydrogenase family)
VLTVDGDIADPATADRIIGGALERFGRIDTLVNNAGVYISKPFTDYTAEDYALMVGVNLTGFFWLIQRAIAEMLQAVWRRGCRHLGHYRGLRELQLAFGPGRADQGRPGLGHPVTRRRVRLARHPGQRCLAGCHPDAGAPGPVASASRGEPS